MDHQIEKGDRETKLDLFEGISGAWVLLAGPPKQ